MISDEGVWPGPRAIPDSEALRDVAFAKALNEEMTPQYLLCAELDGGFHVKFSIHCETKDRPAHVILSVYRGREEQRRIMRLRFYLGTTYSDGSEMPELILRMLTLGDRGYAPDTRDVPSRNKASIKLEETHEDQTAV